MEEITTIAQASEQEEVFSLKDFFAQCAAKWQMFVVSVLVLCSLGVLYILRQQPVYMREMAVLIKDQDGGASAADISSAFSSMGLVASNTNVNNELISLTSPAVMYEVIARLGLDVSYLKPGAFHGTTLYGTTLPYNVKFLDLEEQQSAGFQMDVMPNGDLQLSKFYMSTPDGNQKFDKEMLVKASFQPVKTPVGKVMISPNGSYIPSKGAKKEYRILVDRSGMQSSVEAYSNRLKGDLADKDAEVINLSIRDVSTQRAVDILNNVVEVYNENWVHDKNKIAVATSSFIDDRLRIIESELGNVDSDISRYKSEHLVPDLSAAAKLNLEQSAEMSNNILQATNQMQMALYLRDYINNPSNAQSVIPVNTGIGSPALETQINTYNNVLLNRNTLMQSTSASNPLVQDYDTQLRGLRESISRGINAQVGALKTSLRNMQGAKGQADGNLASGPTQAKYLLSVERQQKVKESLYLYLLQKREENELTQTFTAYNTRIITPPTGSLRPVAPKKSMILGVTFLLGLCIPGVLIYISEATNMKVRNRKDLDNMEVPFAGEIPFIGKRARFEFLSKLLKRKKEKKPGELETVLEVVKDGSRDAISESFRIIRGNIDFMADKSKKSNVIMITSFNPGSGKSFISYNLSASFALKDKKVLVIDGDLRHGSFSQFVGMPSKGLSNYLTGATDDYRSLIVPVPGHKNMYVMPIGHRPPNPAELLENGRMEELMGKLREDYDYVVIDCPPTNVVVDTNIVEQFADRTIFIVRAGLLDRRLVSDIDVLYKEKRFKNMCLILNGTERQYRGYGNSYYGNGYGGSYDYYGSTGKSK